MDTCGQTGLCPGPFLLNIDFRAYLILCQQLLNIRLGKHGVPGRDGVQPDMGNSELGHQWTAEAESRGLPCEDADSPSVSCGFPAAPLGTQAHALGTTV